MAGSYSGVGQVNLTFSYPVRVDAVGAVYILGGANSWVMQSNVTMQGVSFTGAARAVLVNTGVVTFSDCEFANNTNGNFFVTLPSLPISHDR